MTPYSSFVNNSFYYSKYEEKVYEYKYRVQFSSKQQLKKAIWQQIRYFQSSFEFLLVERDENTNTNTYFLTFKFVTLNHITLSDYLRSIKSYACSFLYLLFIFFSVVKFVGNLHKQGLVLYSPLQHCLFMKEYK